MAITLKQFIDKYNGKKADYDGAYGAQCVDLFRFYNKEVLDISQPRSVNGAKDFWSNYNSDPILNQNFKKISNTPEFIAEPGDVMIWNGYYGPYGHIAIIVEADINKFTVLSQNDPSGRETHLKEYTYSKVYGVLRPNKDVVEKPVDNSELEDCLVTRDRYKEERNKCSAELGELQADLEQQKTITSESKKEMNTFMETLASKLKVIVDKGEIIGSVDRLLEVESQLAVANKKLLQQEKKHEVEKGDLKDRIKELSDAVDKSILENITLRTRLEELEAIVDEKIIVKTEFSILGWFKSLFNK